MKHYKIKEIHLTWQGEGYHTGRRAVFVRFTGCNLWSGREEDRHKAICQFCDTDFVGTDGHDGGHYSAKTLTDHILNLWDNPDECPYAVFTGGEPLLQLDEALIAELKRKDIIIALESNGTLPAPEGIDWICMSPKANTTIVQDHGQELKIVFPQEGIDPKDFNNMKFEHRFLQPMDGNFTEQNTEACRAYIQENRQWQLSVQTHKILGIP